MNKFFRLGAALVFCGIVLKTLSCMSSAAEAKNWFIKRNGNSTPGFPEFSSELSRYGGYYIDKDAVKNNKKRLYLTFDAGYDNGNLEKILDTLKSENVPAAFFILKNLIYKDADLVCRMAEEGHLVCNHTATHKNLTKSNKEEVENELCALENIYTKQTGRLMSKYFRFPEGKYSLDCIKHVNELGYKTVFWSFAYEDWDNCNQPSENYAIKKIMDNTHNGAVLLLHPNSKTNATILPELIRLWKAQGYEFCSLNDLVEFNKPSSQ